LRNKRNGDDVEAIGDELAVAIDSSGEGVPVPEPGRVVRIEVSSGFPLE
jgi:hypothetical protein